MARRHDSDDFIQQNLERGDRSRSAREPTRPCGSCTNGQVTEMREDGVNAKGKPVFKNETKACRRCGGSGLR
jgi:hypothetical protein